MKRLADVLSWVFQPLLITTLVFASLFYFAPLAVSPMSGDARERLLILIFLVTFIIPAVSLIIFKISSSIASLFMENRKERYVPFAFITIFYATACYLFIYKFQLNTTFAVVMVSITLTILLITIITFFWKISAHSAGMCGLVGFLLAFAYKFPENNLFYPLILSILLAGAVLSARLYLNAHSASEVGGGAVLGFTICFLSVFFFV